MTEDIRDFVTENFNSEPELEPWTPDDWRPDTTFPTVKPEHLQFCQELNRRWRLLGRKVHRQEQEREQEDHEQRSSLLALPHGMVVPGGRFRETYYWDSYWVVRGLLACGMVGTARYAKVGYGMVNTP